MKNIGLVGMGFIGKIHYEAYQHLDNCRVKAVCKRSNHSIAAVVTDYEDLLNDHEIDIIDICLPTYLHEEYIIKAAEAGKHIFCEKPLTLTLESAEHILETVRKNKVNLFVGHVLRFWPEYKAIKSLSDIEVVYAKRLGQVPQWSTWFQDPAKSGGALFDLHIHDIDFVCYLLGEVDSVYAVGTQNKQGAWDHVMTTLTFKNNSKAFVEASQRMPTGYPFTMSFRAQTASGTLDYELVSGANIDNSDDSKNNIVYYSGGKGIPVEVEQGDAFQNELAYFVDCIENNLENSVISLDEVIYTLKVLKAIEKSLATGQVVRF